MKRKRGMLYPKDGEYLKAPALLKRFKLS